MRRRLCFLVASLLAGAGCEHAPSSRDYPEFSASPAPKAAEVTISKKKIVTWKKDPRKRRTVGWLEEKQVQPKGTRTWETVYQFRDAQDQRLVGFATERGVFYRYDAGGYTARLGEWTVRETGIKIFFEIPLEDGLSLESLDPYSN